MMDQHNQCCTLLHPATSEIGANWTSLSHHPSQERRGEDARRWHRATGNSQCLGARRTCAAPSLPAARPCLWATQTTILARGAVMYNCENATAHGTGCYHAVTLEPSTRHTTRRCACGAVAHPCHTLQSMLQARRLSGGLRAAQDTNSVMHGTQQRRSMLCIPHGRREGSLWACAGGGRADGASRRTICALAGAPRRIGGRLAGQQARRAGAWIACSEWG